MDKVVQSSTTG